MGERLLFDAMKKMERGLDRIKNCTLKDLEEEETNAMHSADEEWYLDAPEYLDIRPGTAPKITAEDLTRSGYADEIHAILRTGGRIDMRGWYKSKRCALIDAIRENDPSELENDY